VQKEAMKQLLPLFWSCNATHCSLSPCY